MGKLDNGRITVRIPRAYWGKQERKRNRLERGPGGEKNKRHNQQKRVAKKDTTREEIWEKRLANGGTAKKFAVTQNRRIEDRLVGEVNPGFIRLIRTSGGLLVLSATVS